MHAEIVPTPDGRFEVVRVAEGRWTVEVDCPTRKSAESERSRLQAYYDAVCKPIVIERRLVHGFYTDADGQGVLL